MTVAKTKTTSTIKSKPLLPFDVLLALSDGIVVGNFVSKLGPEVGLRVGVVEGWKLGIWLGTTLGMFDGLELGCTEGMFEGIRLGNWLGNIVWLVGTLVGVWLGELVATWHKKSVWRAVHKRSFHGSLLLINFNLTQLLPPLSHSSPFPDESKYV